MMAFDLLATSILTSNGDCKIWQVTLITYIIKGSISHFSYGTFPNMDISNGQCISKWARDNNLLQNLFQKKVPPLMILLYWYIRTYMYM